MMARESITLAHLEITSARQKVVDTRLETTTDRIVPSIGSPVDCGTALTDDRKGTGSDACLQPASLKMLIE